MSFNEVDSGTLASLEDVAAHPQHLPWLLLQQPPNTFRDKVRDRRDGLEFLHEVEYK